MTTVTLNPEFESLLAGLDDTRLPDFSLDHFGRLGNFWLDEDDVVGDIILTSTGISAQVASRDPSDSTLYTFKITGTGIRPSGTLDQLGAAIENGTANGTLTQISIDYGNLRIAQLDIAPQSLTLSSGNQSLELTGGFPVTLSQIINLVDILDGEAEGSLDDYGFTGFSLRDGSTVLASLQTGENFTLNLDGFTLAMTGADVSVEDIFDFINPGRGQIVPEITLFNSTGDVVAGTPFSFSNDSPNFVRIAYENLPQGTYYAQVRASDQQVVDWQTQTGQYLLFSSWWGSTPNAGQQTFESMGDAPANNTTPYVLNSGSNFSGVVDSVGDADWIKIEFPEWSSTYTTSDDDTGEQFIFNSPLVLQAFGTGQIEPQLRDLEGFSFDSLTITTPDGTEILSATNVASFRDFIDALDEVLNSLFLPNIGGLGLAFATGDPHLLTHDGLGYDFHAAGEFVLMRATNGQNFELQSRMSPAGENVTANVAAALRVGDDTIMIAPGATPLLINGAAYTLADGGAHNVGSVQIERFGDRFGFTISDPAGFGVSQVVVDIIGSRVDIGVGLSSYWQNNVEGLLGNFSGSIRDDLQLANGTRVTFPLTYGDDPEAGTVGIYGRFRDDWRVTEAKDNSLFTYAEGEGPESFYLPDYPTQMITLDDFSTEEQAAAEATAAAAGLTPGTFAFNNAVLDLLITQDESFVESAVNSNTAINNVDPAGGGIHVPQVAGGGITDSLLSLSGSVKDLSGQGLSDTTVTFRPAGTSVDLTRMTRDGDSFNFDLSQNAAGRLDASRDWQEGDPTITALDALDVLRMAVGLDPSFGPAKAQNFIAADINGDGAVTALDALEVLRAAVGLESASAPRWAFFDAATDWDAMELSRQNTNVETGVEIASFSASVSGFDMVGILLGNMESV